MNAQWNYRPGNLSQTAEYGSNVVLGKRTVRGTKPGINGATVTLEHKTAGYYPAGSCLRLDSEAWGRMWTLRDGTQGGRWFRTEEEARAAFSA